MPIYSAELVAVCVYVCVCVCMFTSIDRSVCVRVCVCVCLRLLTGKASSVWDIWNAGGGQVDCVVCVEYLSFLCQVPSSLL